MFNLEKAITLWKNEFEKNDSFTNEDIEELEGHLLDKIDALTKSGLNEEEAFIKANENIGTAEVLHNDFSSVNKIGILTKRMILGVFGYIFIVFLTDIVRIITTFIMLPFSKKLVDILVSRYSLSGWVMSFFIGDGGSNKLLDSSIIISSLLSIILIYLLVSNRFNIINKINRIVNKEIYSKSNLSVPKVIIIMTMITGLVVVTPIIGNIIGASGNANEIGSISIGISISGLIFDFMLAFIFIYKLCGKSIVNRNILVALGGYLIGNALIIIIPKIVWSIFLGINAEGISLKAIYLGAYILVTAIFTLIIIGINKKVLYRKSSNNNKSKDKSFVMRISLSSLILIIDLGLNLFIYPIYMNSVYGNNLIIRIDELMVMDNVMKLVIIVIAQFIVSIILIRKVRVYRKVA